MNGLQCEYAPVLLFVYNRVDHTRRTLEALSLNTLAQETELYIYADGPKEGASDEQLKAVDGVRTLIRSRLWCKKVHIVETEKNTGLAASVIRGVTEIVRVHGKVIVLEDDLITSPYFLDYMNDSLNAYADDIDVISISGYMFPVKKKVPQYFFLNAISSWGWATWENKWRLFNPDGRYLLDQIEEKDLEREFNLNDTYDFTGMLRNQITGKVDSWAIRWRASAFLLKKLTLYPGTSYVQNIGFDGTGTNCGESADYETQLFSGEYNFYKVPTELSARGSKALEDYYDSPVSRKIRKCKNIVKRILHKIHLYEYK